jgi:hypothetical protein
MVKRPKKNALTLSGSRLTGYEAVLADVVGLLEEARRTTARAVNAVMTATYWVVGRRMVQSEQGGKERAEYGKALLKRLSADLTSRFGRGFSARNLQQMRLFYTGWPIPQTVSAESQSGARAQSEVGISAVMYGGRRGHRSGHDSRCRGHITST